jgi:hypothetical protein
VEIPYVSYCDKTVRLKNLPEDLETKLVDLGGKRNTAGEEYLIPVLGREDTARIFTILQKMGVAFSAGREWSPAEQFEELREKGFVSGKFLCIEWLGAGTFRTREL